MSLFIFIPGFKVSATQTVDGQFIYGNSYQYVSATDYDFSNFNFTYNNITYTKDYLYEIIENYLNDNNYTIDDFTYIFISTPKNVIISDNTMNSIQIELFSNEIAPSSNVCYHFRGYDFEGEFVRSASSSTGAEFINTSKYAHLKINLSDNSVSSMTVKYPEYLPYSSWAVRSMYSNKSYNIYSNYFSNTFLVSKQFDFKIYSTFYYDENLINFKPKSYNVTFHLNGGIVYDNNYITDNKGSYIIGNKYEDYTTMIQTNNLREYLQNQDVKKESMDFKGWYYDEKLTLKVDPDDVLTGDTNLYAKFLYTDVEDFLKNTTFNTYTFDTDYEYAIISLNSKTNKDIYLGLNYIDYSLEIYKYLKKDNEYKQGSVKCLIPYYSKDNKYYYWLESPLDNDYEVLILPKGKFKDNNYEFLLSNNAYVSYTNDLTKVIIKNDDGQDIETNLENSYNYSQDSLINNENNIIEIFKKLSENKNNNVFSYFNQIWNYIKRSKLYTYLLTLIIGSLIILIIHVAKR